MRLTWWHCVEFCGRHRGRQIERERERLCARVCVCVRERVREKFGGGWVTAKTTSWRYCDITFPTHNALTSSMSRKLPIFSYSSKLVHVSNQSHSQIRTNQVMRPITHASSSQVGKPSQSLLLGDVGPPGHELRQKDITKASNIIKAPKPICDFT